MKIANLFWLRCNKSKVLIIMDSSITKITVNFNNKSSKEKKNINITKFRDKNYLFLRLWLEPPKPIVTSTASKLTNSINNNTYNLIIIIGTHEPKFQVSLNFNNDKKTHNLTKPPQLNIRIIQNHQIA